MPVPPIVVADDVEVTPPTTWEFVPRSDEGDCVILSNGSANLAVAVDRSTDSASSALASYLAQMQADAIQFFSGDPIAFELAAHAGRTRAPWAVQWRGVPDGG